MNLNKIDMTEEIEMEQEQEVTTVEGLVQRYESLKFFDSELRPTDNELLFKANYDTELLVHMIMETTFVNRMNTIMKNENWVKQHEHRSDWKKNQFKNKILDPKSEVDKFGNIKGWGMKMTEDEWDTYQAAHDVIFITEDVE